MKNYRTIIEKTLKKIGYKQIKSEDSHHPFLKADRMILVVPPVDGVTKVQFHSKMSNWQKGVNPLAVVKIDAYGITSSRLQIPWDNDFIMEVITSIYKEVKDSKTSSAKAEANR